MRESRGADQAVGGGTYRCGGVGCSVLGSNGGSVVLIRQCYSMQQACAVCSTRSSMLIESPTLLAFSVCVSCQHQTWTAETGHETPVLMHCHCPPPATPG